VGRQHGSEEIFTIDYRGNRAEKADRISEERKHLQEVGIRQNLAKTEESLVCHESVLVQPEGIHERQMALS